MCNINTIKDIISLFDKINEIKLFFMYFDISNLLLISKKL
jgi:hypothetical protein